MQCKAATGQAARQATPVVARTGVPRAHISVAQALRVSGPIAAPAATSSFKPQLGRDVKTRVAEVQKTAAESGDVSVSIDNKTDSKYTIVEVHAPNRPGLLQALSNTFKDLSKWLRDADESGVFGMRSEMRKPHFASFT